MAVNLFVSVMVRLSPGFQHQAGKAIMQDSLMKLWSLEGLSLSSLVAFYHRG